MTGMERLRVENLNAGDLRPLRRHHCEQSLVTFPEGRQRLFGGNARARFRPSCCCFRLEILTVQLAEEAGIRPLRLFLCMSALGIVGQVGETIHLLLPFLLLRLLRL
jgi:hypothetical protein